VKVERHICLRAFIGSNLKAREKTHNKRTRKISDGDFFPFVGFSWWSFQAMTGNLTGQYDQPYPTKGPPKDHIERLMLSN
jgi:hypothetical protein